MGNTYKIICAIVVVVFLLPVFSSAQNRLDKKVIVTLSDTAGIYNKVKHALVEKDFIVKDNGNATHLVTYPREFKTIKGFSVVNAVIENNTVTITGAYGLIKIDGLGYTATPKQYRPIVYYKGSVGWEVLMKVAELIGGEITYAK